MNEVHYSAQTEEWETPQWFFDDLNSEFKFDLDPCASENNAKCQHYFTKEQDGLTKDWGKHCVFINPPYGRKIGAWIKKAFETQQVHKNTIVMLLPARTDTKWFHEYIYHKAEIRFIKGRLKFGNSMHNAPFPNMVVVYGER